MKLRVVVRPEEDGRFSAAVPALPGCASWGETLEEAVANVREAAEGMIEAMNEQDPFRGLEPAVPPLFREIEL